MLNKKRKGVIVFSDMKNYSIKSSLLTNMQLSKIIDDQEKIFVKHISKNNGKIIKSLGDGFMIFFDNSTNALNSIILIEKEIEKYNKSKKIPLFQIEIRFGMDYGDFIEKKTILGKDYFGETINIASRLETDSLIDGILLTKNAVQNLGENVDNFNLNCVGKKELKGIFEKIEIYQLVNDKTKILNNTIIKKDNLETQRQEKINNLIFKISSIGAIISIQPIPFIDIYNLLALQTYLLNEISKIYGLKISVSESKDIILKITGIFGINYILNQSIISLSKIGIPIIGGYLIIPITFSLTYSSGKVINNFLYYKSNNLKLEEKEIKELFVQNLKKGRVIGKKQIKEIKEIGNNNKNIFIEKIKIIYKKYNLSDFYNKIINKSKK